MTKKTSDTRKQVWKFQEGAVVLAVREAVGSAAHVHWHHTPKGMSIDPDVLVGKNPDRPETVVFVTHASAEMAGQKKFWRTIAEIIEAKRLKSHPLLVSVLFPGNVKEALKDVYTRAFEACVHLDDAPYGKQFTSLIDKMTEAHGTKSEDDCIKHLSKHLGDAACGWWRDFVADIKKALKKPHGAQHLLMCSASFSHREHLPKARSTTLRRSICKLFTLPEAVRNAVLDGKSVDTVPQHALLLGWFQEGIDGCELSDSELYQFCKTNPPNVARCLCDHAKETQQTFLEYSESLIAISEARERNEWILENFQTLATASGMINALSQVFANPKKLPGAREESLSTGHHWLFQTVISVLRAETGRKDGYGYSELDRDTGGQHKLSGVGQAVAISAFTQCKKALPAPVLSSIASAFARHFVRLGRVELGKVLVQAITGQCEAIFNFQMMNYRFFNPVDWLVNLRLKAEGFPFFWPATHESFLNTSDGEIASSTGNLICVGQEQVWIKCQSAYDGKIDKRKELCGRVGAMKLCYTAKELEKVRFYLVLDGFFEDSDLSLLGDAGWDGVFYYDQLDLLIGLVNRQVAPRVLSKYLDRAKKRPIQIDATDSADLPMAAEDE